MRIVKRMQLGAVLLTLAINAAHICAAEHPPLTFNDVQYTAKSVDGHKSRPVKGELCFDSDGRLLLFSAAGNQGLHVPYADITSAVYERTAKPRIAAALLIAWPLIFTKSKQHYLTLQYREGEQGTFALFRLDKGNYAQILGTVEAQTGIKVERTEER